MKYSLTTVVAILMLCLVGRQTDDNAEPSSMVDSKSALSLDVAKHPLISSLLFVSAERERLI
jgi:hypothetical protein